MAATTMRQKYTEQEREAAIAEVRQHGILTTARKFGIGKTTLWRWTRTDGGSSERGVVAAKAEEAPTSSTAVPPQVPRQGVVAAKAEEAPIAEKDVSERTSQHKRSPARRYTPSQKAAALEYASEHGVSGASEHFDISRFSIYQWRRQVRLAAEGKGDSPTTGPDPQDIESKRDKEILDLWHEHPGLGPSQISNQLRRKGVKVAVNTVRRVMEDAGYRPPKVRSHPHDKRFEAVRPNHIWHLDYLHRHINRASTNTLILLDDYSRFVVGHGVDDAERADLVIDTFSEAVERHGRPERVLHDKGSAFWSWRGISRYTALLTELGIDQIVAEHKEWNGKLEVFNANLAKELFDAHRFYDLAEMRRRLAAHLHWYNHRRTHHALGGLLVPADRFYGRVEEVMARIESGAGANVHTDLLDLRDRVLELFRVTSSDGKPEIWLMGNRLLPLPAQ